MVKFFKALKFKPLRVVSKYHLIWVLLKEDDMRYICANCGYTYDPDQGDPMNDIPPGTAFADLPENWVCPLCYATMDSFDPLD